MKNTDKNNNERGNNLLIDDNKRLLEILELVESQYKLATKHYELWKNLLTTLTKEK